MLTGKKLGLAIREAIELKLAAGTAKTKKEIADHFGVRPPSLHDWIDRGTIGKDKLVEMFQYFSDVVGPEHWGLSENFQAANTSPGPDIHGSDHQSSRNTARSNKLRFITLSQPASARAFCTLKKAWCHFIKIIRLRLLTHN